MTAINFIPMKQWAVTTEKLNLFSHTGYKIEIKKKKVNFQIFILYFFCKWGQAVAQLVEALAYKLEGLGFDPLLYHLNFPLT